MSSRLGPLVIATWALVTPALVGGQVVYEYTYPYNTPDLIEDHFIVLDAEAAPPRGWYYGTSDEFDVAREGYPPGFFVAAMADLTLTDTSISFTLTRPARFFTASVPLEYRDVGSIPAGLLEEWSVPLVTESRSYTGTRTREEIALAEIRPPRVFRRRAE